AGADVRARRFGDARPRSRQERRIRARPGHRSCRHPPVSRALDLPDRPGESDECRPPWRRRVAGRGQGPTPGRRRPGERGRRRRTPRTPGRPRLRPHRDVGEGLGAGRAVLGRAATRPRVVGYGVDTRRAMTSDRPLRVFVADDQELVRSGFKLILESNGIEVVGEAADGRAAVAEARRLRPDVALLDIRMPEMDGLEATRKLAAPGAEDPIPVVVVTTFDLDEYVYTALRNGASGFLLKDAGPQLLVEAVHAAARGDA